MEAMDFPEPLKVNVVDFPNVRVELGVFGSM